MKISATRPALAPLLALALLTTSSAAEQTRIWRQGDYEQFRKGVAEGVSLSSDGRVRLASALEELHDAPASYIWDLAVAPDGAVYAAMGPEARVVRIRPGGEPEIVFETDAVEVHAIALGADGTLYAATNPSGQVYRISPDGDSDAREQELLYDPGAAAIWDLAIGPGGDLFVAAGDRGEIHRVRPDGEGGVYFETGETHVRTLAIDAEGRLLAGTDPGGMVFRITESAGGTTGFVLYQSPKAELTALAVDAEGAVYAAGAGAKSAAPSPKPPAPAPGGDAGQSSPAAASLGALRGGSEIVRIAPGGEPEMFWRSADEIAYALGFAGDGALLAGTGPEGRLFRIDNERLFWLERTLASDQITAIASGADGTAYLAASNVGKVFSLGPGTAEQGELLSEPLDAGGFARWGRLEYSGSEQGLQVSLRTGNVRRPGSSWSPWSAAVRTPSGARVETPGARYGQWRIELTSPQAEASEVRQYYRPANQAPVLTHLELTPPNFRLPPRSRTIAPVVTRALPPLGAAGTRRSSSASPTTMTQAAGWMGVRWRAIDPNGDELEAAVRLRGEDEDAWTTLEASLREDEWTFDSSGFADGWYRLQVEVSDAPSNPPGEQKAATRRSERFLIDNSAPAVRGLSATAAGEAVRVRFDASDAASRIREAAVSINGGDWIEIAPEGGLFDGRELQFDATLGASDARLLAVRIRDEHGNQTVAKTAVSR